MIIGAEVAAMKIKTVARVAHKKWIIIGHVQVLRAMTSTLPESLRIIDTTRTAVRSTLATCLRTSTGAQRITCSS